MKMKVQLLFLLVTLCVIFGAVYAIDHNIKPRYLWDQDVMDVTDFSVYYDMKTNKTIKNMMPRPWYKPGWGLRLPFFGGPCECDGAICTCCTGIRIQALNFDRRTCAIISYEPENSTFSVETKLSDVTVMKHTYSTRNPPPFCIPVPIPFLPPGLMDTCVRLFDITIVDQKLHVCFDLDTRIDKAPIVILHFDCMDMGLSGVSLSKPSDSGTDSTDDTLTQLNSDVYDEVTEATEFVTEKTNSIRYI